MNKGSQKFPKCRMIHIRLDVETHKRLKIHAAQTSTTIQQLVEGLICRTYIKSHAKNAK
jgi:predicted HicB family RNase H-like nuclease